MVLDFERLVTHDTHERSSVGSMQQILLHY